MSDTKMVDELAQFIRFCDGSNAMGAGALAERIVERFGLEQHSGMVSVPIEIINRFPKLDMDDYYSHADVCALNEWGVELELAAQE